MKEKGLPGGDQPFNPEEIYLVIDAIGNAAQKVGDEETASYVSQLLAEKKTEDK